MDASLKRAKKLLNLKKVLIRESSFSLSDDVDFMSFEKINKFEQNYETMVKIVELVSKSDDKEERFFYMLRYAVGIRFLREEDKGLKPEEIKPLLVIETDFEACYSSDEEVVREALEAFSHENVGYDIWPYWREFVQSTCARIGIDTITVDPYKPPLKATKIIPDKQKS